MTSQPPLGRAAPAPRPGRAPRFPLRITLVALLMGLVVIALTATGIAATSLLKRYVVEQQDRQLVSTLARYQDQPWVGEACEGGSPWPRGGGPQYSTFYVACLSSSGRIADLAVPLEAETGRVTFSGRNAEVVWAGIGRPVTMRSDEGRLWRLLSEDVGNRNTVVVASDIEADGQIIGQLVRIQMVVGLVVLTVLGAAAYVLVRNSLRPLTEVERTAAAIAAGDLSQRVPAGDDRTEVGRLATALNGMLSRIEYGFRAQQASEEQARASETRMRRFVADASHELRTPLTSIRGFAELYRQGAVGSPEETARLMQRIESEGARMGVLVEDLLQLARLDQQRPLTITPVDLAEVAGDAVHDARALQPDRPLTLHLDESLSEVPVVLGDEARLRQVLGNLVTNALVHTPPTAPVTVTVSDEPAAGDGPADGDDGGVVVLRVADEGPGMAPEDAARVFERFYRADPSRARTAGGTGLGLAIVSALVAAHRGTVHLDTAPGRGAVFTVRLPRSGPGSAVPPVPDGPAA
ncbi:sensor histidine kinase [Geodermatophilus obscurus]|uniref:histidine kinase n=1 Tax=Geodermatophilus obscurus (strain ATCC 25078 / DSM 43160 / JCM 3152 / CCUG 61914 / KCC A-0152 / KCTC 9177 / NBRC 13315 / NRRL B-3577 / G-20) TaxID=526225 RepID=D2S4Q6_GEOOG|nr:HAMP domain-containing sensor histidine kinase [Geodermatophilus obscurus]ADB77206.1 integral membrane sensor signal transduction histidine kinase [Geodermatophilus obscurus DSM 43160]